MKKQLEKTGFDLKGRGILGSLVSSETLQAKEDQKSAAIWVSVQCIKPNRNQPRQFFAPESISSLAKTFQKEGFKGAINVRQLEEGVYEIVAGERRWRAASLAGLDEVRCIVDSYSDLDALKFALIENLQREDLSKLEETEGILRLIEAQYSITKEDAIGIIRTEGHPDKYLRSDVAPSEDLKNIVNILSDFNIELQTFRTKNLRTLLLGDELKLAHLEKGLSYSTALELNKIKDHQKRKELLEKCLDGGLSFRETKAQVKEALETVNTKGRSKAHGKLIKRFESTVKRAKQSSQVLKNAERRKQIENLLKEIELLLEE